MAQTRFNNDPARISKKLQQMTDQGRYILNTPGNGESPFYMADPHIIMQKWGGNLQTNSVSIENELRGMNRSINNKDILGQDNYQNPQYQTTTQRIQYPVCTQLYTEQSRATMPAWTIRDQEQPRWMFLPLNPQEHVCIPFHNNISTRILEKDYYVETIPQLTHDTSLLPPLQTDVASSSFYSNNRRPYL